MCLAQIFCLNKSDYISDISELRYKFEFSETNWYEGFPLMHITLGFRE